MKFILSLFVLVGICLQGQGQNSNDRKIEVEFLDRAQFYSVDERYNLRIDTIYHSNPGFRVFAAYDTVTRNNKKYIIFGYPDWKRAKVHPTVLKMDTLLTKIEKVAKENEEEEVSQKIIALIKEYFPNGVVGEVQMTSFMTQLTDARIGLDQLNSMLQEIGDELQTDERDELDGVLEEIQQELNKQVHPIREEIYGRNGLKLAILESDFREWKNTGKVEDVYSLKPKNNKNFTSGFMTVPFKLRPKQDSVNFNMTTDITLGAYAGFRLRISRRNQRFIVFPATLGLSYINVANSETSNVNTEDNSSVVPGWTWSTGVVFDLDGFNIGFVLGKDYASGVGKDWLYNKKTWYSFAIGYSFISKRE